MPLTSWINATKRPINRYFTTIAAVSGKIRFQHVSTVCNSRFSKPSVVLWWDGFGRFGIKTATICTIPRAARSEDWVKVVSGGRWMKMKHHETREPPKHLYLSKGDEHERVLFAVPSTLQNSPFETQKATLHIHFELLSLPLSIWSSLTVTLCQSLNHLLWFHCPKVQKFLSSFWGPFNSYSIHSLKGSILLTTSNAINAKMQSMISIVLSSLRFIWWILIPQDAWSAVICMIHNTNKRKVQGPTQSSKTSHRILCSTELCTLRMWPLKISFSERIFWHLRL